MKVVVTFMCQVWCDGARTENNITSLLTHPIALLLPFWGAIHSKRD